MSKVLDSDTIITICAVCKRSCCWQGQFMCDAARYANIQRVTVGELRRYPNGEDESWWEKCLEVEK